MDFKGALLKGMSEIPSSSSLKLNTTQPQPKIEPQQLSSVSFSSILRDSELIFKQSGPKIEIQPLSSSSILRHSSTKLNPGQVQPKPEIKVHKISSRPVPKIKIQQLSSFSILQDTSTEKNNYRDWLDLPRDLMESIMQRIGWYEVLMSAKNVCKTWREICKGLSVWEVIEIRQVRESEDVFGKEFGFEKVTIYFGEHAIEIDCAAEGMELAMKLAMHVIDLSSGQLLDLCIHRFGSNHLLQYISHRHEHHEGIHQDFLHGFS